jgi:hypothetical protein
MLVGLLRSRKDLERAVAQFGSAGWQCSDLSLLSKHNVLLPDYLTVQTARIADEDAALNSVSSASPAARQMRIFITACGGVIAALVAAALTVFLGGSGLNAGIAAVLAGSGAVISAEFFGHRVRLLRKYYVPEQGRYSGILLWVRMAGLYSRLTGLPINTDKDRRSR